MYCYRVKDDYLKEIEHEFNYLKKQKGYEMWHPEQLLLVVILREFKILNKRVEHLENLGEEDKKVRLDKEKKKKSKEDNKK